MDHIAEKVVWDDKAKFIEYFLMGWIRPDMLPVSKKFDFKKRWFEFFRSLNTITNHSVNGGIFRNWDIFEKYHTDNVRFLCLEA